MKRPLPLTLSIALLVGSIVSLSAGSLAGCKTATATTPPAALAPGALNQFDSDAYQSLSAAHAFAGSASANASTLTPTEIAALNTFITALNAADLLYISYHNGQATQVAMETSLNNVTMTQAAFSATVTGAK
jgi:hypothetical protein